MPEPHPEDAPPTETPAASSPQPKPAMIYGGAFMYLFVFGLPGLKLLTSETSQLHYHFSMATYFAYLGVLAVLALPVGGLLYLVWRTTTKLEPLQRVLGALLLTLPVPIFLQMAAMKLEWFTLTSGLMDRYALVVWIALLVPIAVSSRVFRLSRKAAGIVARVLAPLPVVMFIYFLGAPSVPSVREPAPGKLASERKGAPVYILMFDALDREVVFDDQNAGRYPTLFELKQQGVWFENSDKHGAHTAEIVPCFLYQQDAEVTRGDDGAFLLDGVPATNHESLFTRLAGEETVTVLGGFHLNYSRLVGEDVDWLREYSYYNANDSVVGIGRTHLQLLLNNMYVPNNPPMRALKSVSATANFTDDTAADIQAALEDQLMACARAPNHDLVAFFHMTVPHPPYIYDRAGRMAEPPSVDTSNDAYLLNVEYVDALLQRFIDALKESGQWGRCTLVILGDHGIDYVGPPPLIVHLAGQQQGRVVKERFSITSLADWLKSQPGFTAR